MIGGVGGIERGQRNARYHELAYLEDEPILRLLEGGPVDLLITHQGPGALQGSKGSPSLDLLLEAEVTPLWFHGHSIPNPDITSAGPNNKTTVVPLDDVAFPMRGDCTDEPGHDGWCRVSLDGSPNLERKRPEFWRDYRKTKWHELPDGRLVAPPLSISIPS